ncbi:MAG: cytochrome c3 family protein [Planctomycetota bacterium]
MKSPAPEKRSFGARVADPRLWFGIVSASLVTWFAIHTAQHAPGPGPISQVHAAQPELAGASGCAGCHGESAQGGIEAMQRACVHCHTPIGEQLAATKGFHGTLENASDCGRCHGEHLGRDVAPFSAETFELAGFATREAYDHQSLSFNLVGAHSDLACVACHKKADAAVGTLAQGLELPDDHAVKHGRFIGLQQACATCHRDPHEGRFGASCADCHGQERPFAEAALFEHTAAFPLAGAHAGHACVDCHVPGSAHAIEAEAAAAPSGASVPLARQTNGAPTAVRSCAECHDSPHGVAFVAAQGSTCATCHSPELRGFAAAEEAHTRAAHAAVGFALVDAHAAVACEGCHDPSLPFDERHSKSATARAASACATCHDDPHRGQFGDALAQPGLCAQCHTVTTFAAHTFDAAAHAAAGFALDGAHTDVACNQCHPADPAAAPGAVASARFAGTPRACASCHEDVHGGTFDRAAATATVPATGPAPAAGRGVAANVAQEPAGCARCHDTTSFRGPAEGFEHARWTGYALAGAHAAVACQVCHLPEPNGGRRLGPVAASFRPGASRAELAACTACHGDPHDGRFEAVQVASLVDGRVGCARCHTTTDFAEVPPSRFDHGSWTGFELRGAHGETPCIRCHGEGVAPNQESIRDGRVARRLGVVAEHFSGPLDRCATCHENPHGERYDVHAPALVEGRVGCARCHAEVSFRVPRTFDHDWTGFTLVGRHADLACAKCHAPLAPNATGRSHGPVLGLSCAACHQDPHGGQFQVAGATDCARCHTPEASFKELEFDHATDTRFPLDETHAPLACAACHRPARTRDGRELVRYRPLGTACADCHGTTGRERK